MGSISGYEKHARTVERLCKITFPELGAEAGQRIATVVLCACHADNYIDSQTGATRKGREQNVLDYLSHGDTGIFEDRTAELINWLMPLKQLLDVLPPDRSSKFRECVARIFECGDVLLTTTRSRIFIRARLEEGRRSADLVVLAVDEPHNHPPAADFYRRLLATGNLLDTLKDFKNDRRNGEIKLPVSGLFPLAATSFVRLGAAIATSSRPQRRFIFANLGRYLRGVFRKGPSTAE